MQVCTLLQTDNHASTHHSVFYRPDARQLKMKLITEKLQHCWCEMKMHTSDLQSLQFETDFRHRATVQYK